MLSDSATVVGRKQAMAVVGLEMPETEETLEVEERLEAGDEDMEEAEDVIEEMLEIEGMMQAGETE